MQDKRTSQRDRRHNSLNLFKKYAEYLEKSPPKTYEFGKDGNGGFGNKKSCRMC